MDNITTYDNVETRFFPTSTSIMNQTTDKLLRRPVVDSSLHSVCVSKLKSLDTLHDLIESAPSTENRYRRLKSYPSLDLSTIRETNQESSSLFVHREQAHSMILQNKNTIRSIKKRQPLQEMDVNSFNDEKRKIDNERNLRESSSVFILVSDNDQENLPVTVRKRSMLSSDNKIQAQRNRLMDNTQLQTSYSR